MTMSKKRLDTTLRARSRAGASPHGRVMILERRARTILESGCRAINGRGENV